MVLFINPANHAPGVKNGPARGSFAPIDLQWEKHKKVFFSETTRHRDFLFCVAMFSGSLYKSCQPCPWGQIWPGPGGHYLPDSQWEKHKKNLLLRNHKAQSFHILCVAMYSGSLYKSCHMCPWGSILAPPRGQHGKKIFISETTRPRAFLFCM